MLNFRNLNMKNKILYNFRISYLLLFFFSGGGLFLTSCNNDEDVSGAAPIIERVRFTDPATADSAFTKGTLGSTLVVVGQNLASTSMVYMNDYPININPEYATETHLIVTVLDSVPTVATTPNLPHTLRVINPFGEAVISFETLPPAPRIEQISNTLAKAGDKITLYGSYFFFVDTVFFPGDVYTIEGISTSANGGSMSVTIPEGFDPQEGDLDIFVSSESGNSSASRNTRFYDGNGMITNFDDINRVAYWGEITNTAVGIEPIDGNFNLINMPIPGSYGWNEKKALHFTDWDYTDGSWWTNFTPTTKYDSTIAISNFEIKMEMAVVTTSLEGLSMFLVVYDASGAEIQTSSVLADYIQSTDGTWYTLSIPLNGLGLSEYGDLTKGRADGNNSFRLILQKTTEGDSDHAVIAYDNVRIQNVVD